VAAEPLVSAEAGLVLSAVLGDQGIDLSEAAGLVAVLSGPLFPFGDFPVQARSALTDLFEDAFGAADDSFGPVEALLGLLAVAASGEAPMAAKFFECFLGGPPFLARLRQVGGGSLLVFLEGSECVEGRMGGSVHDRGQPAPFRPEFIDGAGARGSGA
jgi:hypothetical protein